MIFGQLFNQQLWDFVKNCIFDVLGWWDNLQFGSFSFLELLLGFFFISMFIPSVLNLRTVDNAVMSGYSAKSFGHQYKRYQQGVVRNGKDKSNSKFLAWKNSKPRYKVVYREY